MPKTAFDCRTRELWRDRIKECCQSGLSIQAWCLQNELKKTAYHYWVKKFKLLEQQAAGGNTFAEVVLLPENKNSTKKVWSSKAEFSLSFGDYSIGISEGFNAVTLAELVKVLRKL